MILRILSLLILSSASLSAQNWRDYYDIESVSLPDGIDKQVGGIVPLREGGMAVCLYGGEVLVKRAGAEDWTLFGRGLHCPLGILEDADGSLVVMQWSELTRLSDTGSDGVADHYQAVWNDFGVTGNYHEFAFGPARDKEGNFYVSLNLASNYTGIFDNVRGPIHPIGRDLSILRNLKLDPYWQKNGKLAGGMYSRVPYRGCIMKITPDGEGSPFAYGFRSPDGIGFDEQGRLWVTDNQGDWVGTSSLNYVIENGFYGHPASLVWKPDWKGDPSQFPVQDLKSMRTPPAALFPQGELSNSPTQPIPTIDSGKFGLPEGELLVGEMNQPTLIRFLDDEVDGTIQGCLIPFLDFAGLGMGNHRLAFDEEGALWVGKIHLKWPGDEGLRKVQWNGKPLFLVQEVELQKSGFRISFNHPHTKELPNANISKHTYYYHSEYGSPKVNEQSVQIEKAVLSPDRKSLMIDLPEIEEGFLYTIRIEGAKDASGRPLMGGVLRYNVVKKKY